SAVARQRARDEHAAVAGGAGDAVRLAGGPQVSWGPAGDDRGLAYLESDAGAASARTLLSHRGWVDSGGTLEGHPQRISLTRTGGDGGLSGEDAGSDPASLGAWDAGVAGVAPAAAVAQPPEPPWPPDADEVERADHGALCARRGGGHVSRPLSARRPPQECPACGVGRGPRYFHLSRPAGGA